MRLFEINILILIMSSTCTYNRLPEDDSSDSKHIEEIVKIKILV